MKCSICHEIEDPNCQTVGCPHAKVTIEDDDKEERLRQLKIQTKQEDEEIERKSREDAAKWKLF